jgi:hypothetical protein
MQARYHDQSNDRPDFDEITSYAVKTNPSYNRLFGIFTNRSLNSLLILLPGLFVIGGIFGTFGGIMMGFPELTNMDLSDADDLEDEFYEKLKSCLALTWREVLSNIFHL